MPPQAVIASFGFSSLATDVGIVSRMNRLYVALRDKNQIAIIDTTTYTEMGRLLVADGPQFLEVDPGTGRAYVSHDSRPTLIGVLDPHSLEQEIPEELSDAFDLPALGPVWTVKSGPGSYSLTANPGHLRLGAAEPSGAKPPLLLTRKFRGDSWTLENKVSYFTGTSGGARILVWGIYLGAAPMPAGYRKGDGRKATNAIYVYRSRDDWNGCCPGETQLHFVEGGKLVSSSLLARNAADAYTWRIKRDKQTITIERSDDGTNFALVGAYTFGSQIDGVIQYLGISYDSFANNDAYADYDYIRLAKTVSPPPVSNAGSSR